MASLSPQQACLRLADELEQHWSTNAELNRKHNDVLANMRSASDDQINCRDAIAAVMPALACHVEQIYQQGQPRDFTTAILVALAEATREVPFWRPLFGLEVKPAYLPNVHQLKRDRPPDCILDVARRIVSGQLREASSEQMRCALRVMANCCADNNVNRSILVNRDAVEDLLELLKDKKECDLVIPTLYNVCVDYDWLGIDGCNDKPLLPDQQMSTKKDAGLSVVALTAAEWRLGSYWFMYNGAKTSFEILLEAKDHAPSCMGTLADLVELASRVALQSPDNFVREADGDEICDHTVDTTADVLRSLLTSGAELAKEDIDCRVSICQAVINILSQHESYYPTLVGINDALLNLIHLPYNSKSGAVSDEEEQTLEPYRQAILQLIYKISAVEAYTQMFEINFNLIHEWINVLNTFLPGVLSPSRRVVRHESSATVESPQGNEFQDNSPAPQPLASACVLLANSITTTDRARKLLKSSAIATCLPQLFITASDPEVLLPAIDLATRLALTREGQDAMQTEMAHMIPALACILHKRTAEVDLIGLEVQRNAIALARLLIKGSSKHIWNLTLQPAYADERYTNPSLEKCSPLPKELYDLCERTNDAQTKVEAGKFFVEALRTTFTSLESSTAEAATGDAEKNPTGEGNKFSSKGAEHKFLSIFGHEDAGNTRPLRNTVANMITFIITQSQSPAATSFRQQQTSQAEAEGWFGLALLSTITSTTLSIRTVLARDNLQLLNRLTEIVAWQTSPATNYVATAVHPVSSEAAAAAAASTNPLYENIRILVAKLLQPQPQSSPPATQGVPPSSDEQRVQAGLEAAATEMGLDWVIV